MTTTRVFHPVSAYCAAQHKTRAGAVPQNGGRVFVGQWYSEGRREFSPEGNYGSAQFPRFFGSVPYPVNMLQKRIDDQPTISREMVREAEEILHRHIKRVGLKHTAQRDTILRTFLETREHLSTEELHRLVKKKDPKIGFTTVYRTLKLLTECGLASEVAFHDGIARFEHQYNRRSHHHMVCTECGSSVEFFSPEVDRLEQEIGRKHHYLTTRHTFQIYGLCEDCRKKNSQRRVV
jgi:Fur family transcriptional regulator, ferric uptake regulator